MRMCQAIMHAATAQVYANARAEKVRSCHASLTRGRLTPRECLRESGNSRDGIPSGPLFSAENQGVPGLLQPSPTRHNGAHMKKLIAAAALAAVSLLPARAFAQATPHDHAADSPRVLITVSQPLVVGTTILQPGDYKFQC